MIILTRITISLVFSTFNRVLPYCADWVVLPAFPPYIGQLVLVMPSALVWVGDTYLLLQGLVFGQAGSCLQRYCKYYVNFRLCHLS